MGFFEDWDDGKDRIYLRAKVGTILGGLPNEHDLIPSAICVGIYAALLIPCAWRLKNRTLSFSQVWRPLIVILSRITSFAIRIKLSEGQNWNKDLFVAELVLLRISPILLTSALVSLFRDAVVPYLPPQDSPSFKITAPLKYFVSFLQMATYFCLGLTIAIAFDVKQAINGNGEARTKLHRSKEISIYMLLVVNAMIYFLTIIPFVLLTKGNYNPGLVVSKEKEVAKFASIFAVCTFLLVVAGFKASQLASAGLSSRIEIIINKKILFYSICVLGEFIACALFVVLAWSNIVPPKDELGVFCERHHTAMRPPMPGSLPTRGDSQSLSMVKVDSRCPTYTPQMQQMAPRQATIHSIDGVRFEDTSGESYNGYHSGPPFTASNAPAAYLSTKRGSNNTLSTISEVRRYSSPVTFGESPERWMVRSTGAGMGRFPGRGGCGGDEVHMSDVVPSSITQQLTIPVQHHPGPGSSPYHPPRSATESVKSHWSDDSEDDKKGTNGLFTLVKSTRASLTRKNSKGSRTSSLKGGRLGHKE